MAALKTSRAALSWAPPPLFDAERGRMRPFYVATGTINPSLLHRPMCTDQIEKVPPANAHRATEDRGKSHRVAAGPPAGCPSRKWLASQMLRQAWECRVLYGGKLEYSYLAMQTITPGYPGNVRRSVT